MFRLRAGLLTPPPRGWSRALWFAAAAVALHGALLELFAVLQSLFPVGAWDGASDWIGAIAFWILAVPALLLARPFVPLLRTLHLMNAPGWFTWPKPLGFVLVYAVWVVVFFGLAQALRHRGSPPPPGNP